MFTASNPRLSECFALVGWWGRPGYTHVASIFSLTYQFEIRDLARALSLAMFRHLFGRIGCRLCLHWACDPWKHWPSSWPALCYWRRRASLSPPARPPGVRPRAGRPTPAPPSPWLCAHLCTFSLSVYVAGVPTSWFCLLGRYFWDKSSLVRFLFGSGSAFSPDSAGFTSASIVGSLSAAALSASSSKRRFRPARGTLASC